MAHIGLSLFSNPPPPPSVVQNFSTNLDKSSGIGLSICGFDLTACVVPDMAAENALVFPFNFPLLSQLRLQFRLGFDRFGLSSDAQPLVVSPLSIAPQFAEVAAALFRVCRELGWGKVRFVSSQCDNNFALSAAIIEAAHVNKVCQSAPRANPEHIQKVRDAERENERMST